MFPPSLTPLALSLLLSGHHQLLSDMATVLPVGFQIYITRDAGLRQALVGQHSFSWYEVRIIERELMSLLADFGAV
jgi:hypothetical protein